MQNAHLHGALASTLYLSDHALHEHRTTANGFPVALLVFAVSIIGRTLEKSYFRGHIFDQMPAEAIASNLDAQLAEPPIILLFKAIMFGR